jgi:hypothetical protein
LVCLNGPETGQEIELNQEIMAVGRAVDAGCGSKTRDASRQHAEILRLERGYQVRDLQSENGVLVNGQRLAPGGTAWLSEGAELQFASTRFRFYDPSVTATAPALMAVGEPGYPDRPADPPGVCRQPPARPPLSVKQFELLWFLYQNRGRVVRQRRNCPGSLARDPGRYLRRQH